MDDLGSVVVLAQVLTRASLLCGREIDINTCYDELCGLRHN